MIREPRVGDLVEVVSINHTQNAFSRNFEMKNVGDVDKITYVGIRPDGKCAIKFGDKDFIYHPDDLELLIVDDETILKQISEKL